MLLYIRTESWLQDDLVTADIGSLILTHTHKHKNIHM